MIHPSPTQKFVDVSEARISVYEWGEMNPGGQSIVLLHATGFHARCWDQVVRKLDNQHVLAIDLRGHGDSSKNAFDDWSSLAEDVVEVLSKLGVANALGVGHSMGGCIALLCAHMNTSLFAQLLLFDPVIMPAAWYEDDCNPIAVPEGVEHPITRRNNNFPSPQAMFEQLGKKKPYSRFDEAVLKDYCQHGLAMREDGNGYTLACPPDFEASVYQKSTRFTGIYAAASKLEIPVTVVRAQEPEKPEHFKNFQFSPTWPGLAAHLRNGTDIYLPSATHFFPMETPALMADLILNVLSTEPIAAQLSGSPAPSSIENNLTLPEMLKRSARLYSDREAVVDSGARYTYAEFLDAVKRMAQLLYRSGIRKGDRVALLQPPSSAHAIAVFGSLELGAIPVALHVREHGSTLAAIVDQISPKALVYDALYQDIARPLLATAKQLDVEIGARSPVSPAGDFPEGVSVIPHVLNQIPPFEQQLNLSPSDPAAIVLSSGTTGIPKGIVHTHRTLGASARCGCKLSSS